MVVKLHLTCGGELIYFRYKNSSSKSDSVVFYFLSNVLNSLYAYLFVQFDLHVVGQVT